MRKLLLALLITTLFLAGCRTDADIASYNIAQDAEMFRINRRIVFYDAIQGQYLLSIEGRCSIDTYGGQLQVTCKTSEVGFKKHFLGISDNVTYFAEQLGDAKVSVYHHKIIFKPVSIIPDVELH